MGITGTQLSQQFRQQAGALRKQIQDHQALLGEVTEAATQIDNQVTSARRELAAIYLPALTDEAFERAQRLTGFQGFVRRDPRIAVAQERKVLQAQVGKLESDERYQRRDTLVGPAGTLQQELDSSKEALAPLQAECDRFESQVDFLELVQVGYDTHEFKEHWWNAGYWKHWSAGDRICKALGMKDFGDDVLPAYRKYAEPRDVMRGDVERLEKEIDAVHALVQEHDKIADRLAHLDEIYLQSAQDFLGEHLAAADAALLEQWAANEPDARAVQMALRKLAGAQAKQKFVGEIAKQGVPQMISTLKEREQKAIYKAGKFSRPKYMYSSFPANTVDTGFDQKMQGMQAQQDKLRRRLDTLVAAQSYERFQLGNDPELWWWYFLESPPPRYYMPGLFGYYQRRPDVVVMMDDIDLLERERDDAAARAFVAADAAEQGGYLS
jgi:hypothetical protein